MGPVVRGADVLVGASERAGIDVCFANAGSSELAILDAMGRSRIRPIATLFEGVAAAAADGFARMAGRPASVLVHLGIGYANTVSQLHGACRHRSPIVVWVGDHGGELLAQDPPNGLRGDLETLAGLVSTWVRRTRPDRIAADAAQAVAAARARPRGIATLIVPMDVTYTVAQEASEPDVEATAETAPTTIDSTARRLRAAKRPLLLLGNAPFGTSDLADAFAIARATNGTASLEFFPHRVRLEPGAPIPELFRHDSATSARAMLAEHDLLVLVGASLPVAYFTFTSGTPPIVSPTTEVLDLAAGGADPIAVLRGVREALAAAPVASDPRSSAPVRSPAEAACAAIASALPEDAIVVNQGLTAGRSLYGALANARACDYLACTGGSLGFGIAGATGAAVAAPGRRVVAVTGDGTAAYTLQALWSHAREGLDITTVVLVNREYRSLRGQLEGLGCALDGANRSLTDLTSPAVDWSQIARGFGVPAVTADDPESLGAALRESFATPGPRLIAMILPGS